MLRSGPNFLDKRGDGCFGQDDPCQNLVAVFNRRDHSDAGFPGMQWVGYNINDFDFKVGMVFAD